MAKANRAGTAVLGPDVTVKAVKGRVADTNGDGRHSLADVKSGDTVHVFTKRRFVSGDSVSAAFVADKTNPPTDRTTSYRDGGGDWHHCDGDGR